MAQVENADHGGFHAGQESLHRMARDSHRLAEELQEAAGRLTELHLPPWVSELSQGRRLVAAVNSFVASFQQEGRAHAEDLVTFGDNVTIAATSYVHGDAGHALTYHNSTAATA